MPFSLGFWAAAGAGGGAAGAFEQISTTLLTGNAASVTFSSIPSTYRHLQLRLTTRTNRTSFADGYALQLNGVTTASYAEHSLFGNGSSVTSSATTSNTSFNVAVSPGASGGTNIYGAAVIDILDYAQTTKNKTARAFSGLHDSTSTRVGLYSGLWMSTAAVDSVTVMLPNGTNFVAGSRFTLYGIRG